MKLQRHSLRYYSKLVLQTTLVFLLISIFMYVLKTFATHDLAMGVLGMSSFGASAFLAFIAHDTHMAHERRIIASYTVTMLVGIVIHSGLRFFFNCSFELCFQDTLVIAAALAASLSMLAMALLSCEHPPAIGIAIGFSIRDWNLEIIIILLAAILFLGLVKWLVKPWLVNLL